MEINTKFDLQEKVYFVERAPFTGNYNKVQKGVIEDVRLTIYDFKKDNKIREFYRILIKDDKHFCDHLSTDIKPKQIFRNKKDAEMYLSKQLLKQHSKGKLC